jgi:hypothetical protein
MKTLFHPLAMHYAPVFEFAGPDPEEEEFDPRHADDPESAWDDQEEDEFDEEDDGYGAYDNDDDYDAWSDYGQSGEKYGWYNGFSDDVIDDAFEGDPELTWNVD